MVEAVVQKSTKKCRRSKEYRYDRRNKEDQPVNYGTTNSSKAEKYKLGSGSTSTFYIFSFTFCGSISNVKL